MISMEENKRYMLDMIADLTYLKIFITLIPLASVIQSRINKTDCIKIPIRAESMKEGLVNCNFKHCKWLPWNYIIKIVLAGYYL